MIPSNSMSQSSLPPLVTVLMPVYNGAAYIDEAIESILRQTFTDFEFLIIDDGSIDGSADLIAAYDDIRIRLLRNQSNLGLVRTLNIGLKQARGKYLARMDADDISLPHRLACQVAFMDENPSVGVCGTWLEAFDANGATLWATPLSHEEISSCLIFESVIYHPTVIIRMSSVQEHNLCYDEIYQHAEDYELWSRCATLVGVAVVGQVLLRYRLHGNSVGESYKTLQLASADRVRSNLIGRLGIVPTKEELQMHRALSLWQVQPNKCFVHDAHEWLMRLSEANIRYRAFPVSEFSKVLSQRWRYVCFQAAETGLFAYRKLQLSPLYEASPLSITQRLKMLIRCLLKQSRRLRV